MRHEFLCFFFGGEKSGGGKSTIIKYLKKCGGGVSLEKAPEKMKSSCANMKTKSSVNLRGKTIFQFGSKAPK